MKKIISIVAVVVLSIIMVGCTREEYAGEERMVEKQFTASLLEQTRTSLNSDFSVDWKKDDIIRYYSSNSGAITEYQVPEDCHSTHISAKVGESDSYFIAAYGGTAVSSKSGKTLTLSGAINAEQTGAFKDAHISVAKVYLEDGQTDYTLGFSNMTSLIKFTLERTDIQYVIFTASDDTKIHGNGTLKINFNEEVASAEFGEDGGPSIRINTGGAGTFYLATLPCSIGGFSIKCYSENGDCLGVVNGAKTLTLAKDKIANLGTLDSRIEELPATDLSANGTANCYIVSTPGKYKFKANVKGNSTTSLDGTPYKAEVLWESFGTDITPNVGDIVSGAKYKDGYITFTSGQNGNAVIAVKDRDDEILWSWHIWVCDGFDPVATQQEYNNNAGIMMDRNLGATSATPGDVHALGLLYQWGRKDPFLSSSTINVNTNIIAASTLSWPSTVPSNSSNGTITFAIENPTTFISDNPYNRDWLYTGTSSKDDTRWKLFIDEKGLYDPCPYGWRVPDGSENGIWATSFGSSSSIPNGPFDTVHKGMEFGINNGKPSNMQLGNSESIWYPSAGFRSYDEGTMNGVGDYGRYWSCAGACLSFNEDYIFNPAGNGHRATGESVRCVSIVSTPIVPVTGVEINKDTTKIEEGKTEQLTAYIVPANANVKTITWTCDNTAVATVSESGLVTGISEGKCKITAKTNNGLTAECTVQVESPLYVDLGLSVKWAKCNLGASSPEQAGSSFAWGETETKSSFTQKNYKFYSEYSSYYTKYYPRTKMMLEACDDAATAILGSSYRIPTSGEWDELYNDCKWSWGESNGKKGYLIVGKNNNSLFLPATTDSGTSGVYWSNILYGDYGGTKALCCSFTDIHVMSSTEFSRWYGEKIRPVKID